MTKVEKAIMAGAIVMIICAILAEITIVASLAVVAVKLIENLL